MVARVRDVKQEELKLSTTFPFGQLDLPLSSIRSSDHALFPQLSKQVVISGLIFVSVDACLTVRCWFLHCGECISSIAAMSVDGIITVGVCEHRDSEKLCCETD